jgi:hypothetical protein
LTPRSSTFFFFFFFFGNFVSASIISHLFLEMFTNQACEESSGRLIIFLIVSFYLASIAAFQSSLPTKNDQRRTCRREYSSLHLAVESGSMITEITGAYTHCLDTWYLPTQSATGALFSFLGDGIAQANESSPTEMKEYDPTRGLICSFRGLGGGIIWTYWYDTADAWSLALTHNILSSTNMHELWEQTLRTFISIIGEQFLICPVIYSLWDIPVPALFNGSPPSQIPYQIQKKLVPLLIANAMVWT